MRGLRLIALPAAVTFGMCIVAALGKDKNIVTIESFQYNPPKISIKRGQSITFINNDAAPHTVSPEKDGDFVATGRLLQGDKKVVQFDKAGDYFYYCNFHPSMKGEVKVTQ